MKKTPFIILTIVSSLAFGLCSAQSNPDPNKISFSDDQSKKQTPQYNYVYKSRFRNGLFKFFSPKKYNRLISQPGFMPRKLRPAQDSTRYASHSNRFRSRTYGTTASRTGVPGSRPKRGGFGHTGFPVAG